MKVLVLAITVAALLGPAAGLAQPRHAVRFKKDTDMPQVDVLKGPGGMKTYRFRKGIVIKGKAPPHAVIHLGRARLGYEPPVPQKDLASRIAEHLRQSPF